MWKQDDENALLQQALAMSMDDPAVNHDGRDADMSEAATDDPELARGEFLFYVF
jgi:26S proteasome regulatory subunit N10